VTSSPTIFFRVSNFFPAQNLSQVSNHVSEEKTVRNLVCVLVSVETARRKKSVHLSFSNLIASVLLKPVFELLDSVPCYFFSHLTLLVW